MDKKNLRLSTHFLMSEYFGTLLLAIVVSGSCKIDSITNKQTCDIFHLLFVLFISMLIFNRTGDSDFNPGVTYLKYLTYKNEKKRLVAYYMISFFTTQILGSISGFFLIFILKNGFIHKLAINPECSQANAFFVEIVSSCILYLVVIIQDDLGNDIGEREIMKYFFTISGVAAGIAVGGNISGAGMNPAIGIGSNLVRFFVTGDLSDLKYLWIYTLGPFISSHIISSFYNNVYKIHKYYTYKDLEKEKYNFNLKIINSK